MEARKGRDGKTGSMPGTTARPGEAGRRQENLYWIFGLPNPRHGVLVGQTNKDRDGESHAAIGQSLPDCRRAARIDKSGRRGGVAWPPAAVLP
ncbi:MAG: hypothetical protein EPO60_02965 [Rugosibacter sp.]|nr:MAG: hypothetical protein EPO60_02965 [Rugosibacter sp.]